MNASEARKNAEEKIQNNYILNINKIEGLIKAQSDKEKFYCEYYGNMTDEVKKYFQDKGFTIKYIQSGINEYCYKIIW
jgi:hypothetical protein